MQSRNFNESRVPDFIGIGAPKCATTWLFHQLQANPNLYIPPQKELHFFCEWSFREDGIEGYFENFLPAKNTQKCGEICVNYMDLEFSAKTILKLLPNVKVFAVIRNPVDLLYSYYWHLKRQNFHCGYTRDISFEDAIERFPDRLLAPAKIGTNLKIWSDLFGDRLNVLVVDDIRDDPSGVLNELTDFLFDGDSSKRHQVIPASDVRHGAKPRRGFGAIYRYSYYTANRWVYIPAKRIFGVERMEALKERLNVREFINRTVYSGRISPLSKEIRTKLTCRFLPEVILAERVLGRDLSKWKTP